ncbi:MULTISPECIES: LuxR C-terminal-related transcriptional regulator [Gordonia]|uniref:LuxR C-terminal-related transcriptional regulator n=1 Tax=Gordonia TaxID=2053 RepID=UPI0019C0B5F8|nr:MULTISPECIES: LuxR C-terminal-related transcriptional regulator [Gordonia]MBD0021709.1 LuxR family transcriptional regulator [Gordonia sp. (in: high G+C Gram-positive bacteria)]
MNADEWSEIQRCHAEGETIKGIAGRLRMSRNTVRRALAMPAPPVDHRRAKGSVVDEVDGEIRRMLVADPDVTIAAIGRSIGWSRSRTLLARRVNAIRTENAAQPTRPPAAVSPGLPRPATSFVGRRGELVDLRRLLGDHRLVSVVGPGGMGKTRLAIAAAEDFRRAFPDGVRFVDFTAVRSASLLAQSVCDVLSLDNRESGEGSAQDTLATFLRNRRMLLVLDNCEHVVDGAAALVAHLLESTTHLRIIVTSREYLSIPGEHVFHLGALSTEETPDVSPAVELFTRRASSALAGFELTDANHNAVQRICRRLDGLPLAIELACTRLNVLSVHDLADLLDRRMSMLTVGSRDRTARHRSLQATTDWSYELCTPSEQLLWSRLSVFVGGFNLDTAIDVCADDRLPAESIVDAVAGLVAKSVVSRETDDLRARFRLLESIREYGWGKLSPRERDAMNTALLNWCAEIMVDSATHWYGPDQVAKAAVVQENRGNIRAALDFAMASRDDEAPTATATHALGSARFLWACGISGREHRMWLTKALDLPHACDRNKARMFAVLALLQTLQGDRESAAFSIQRARSLADRVHDRQTVALTIHITGLRDFFAGDFVSAGRYFDHAEALYSDDEADLLATLRVHRGMLLSSVLDIAGSRAVFTEVHEAAVAAGESWFHSYATYGLGLTALLAGDPGRAVELASRALCEHRSFGDIVGMTLMAELLGWALAADGSGERAAVVLGAASSSWGLFGQQLYGSEHWNALRAGAVAVVRADLGEAAFESWWARGEALSAAELLDYVNTGGANTGGANTGGVDTGGDGAGSTHTASGRKSAAARYPSTTHRPSTTHAPSTTHSDFLGSLSRREQEVATLVADGLTNKEIAQRLVLSPRTVEGHVEHALRKLNITRRTQLAAALAGSRPAP